MRDDAVQVPAPTRLPDDRRGSAAIVVTDFAPWTVFPPTTPDVASVATLDAVAGRLDRVEAEMRVGSRSATPPDRQVQVASGTLRSYLDAPSFALRLQQIFPANARHAVRTATLPNEGQVGVLATRQYNDHACIAEAQPLLTLLRAFDRFSNALRGAMDERPPPRCAHPRSAIAFLRSRHTMAPFHVHACMPIERLAQPDQRP